MGRRATIVLALLVALSGAVVWIDSEPEPGPGSGRAGAPAVGVATPGAEPLLAIAPDQVASVRLRQGATIREAHRQDGAWVPERTAVLVQDLLQNLARLPVLDDIPAAAGELGAFGLDPPHGTMEVYVAGRPAPVVLEIGDRNPPGSAVYVRLGERGHVVLAGALVRHDFDRTFDTLAD